MVISHEKNKVKKHKCRVCGAVATINTRDKSFVYKINPDGSYHEIKSVVDISGKFYCQECYDKQKI